MRVYRGFDELPSFNNAVVTVGSYDGLHSGHIQLLKRCCKLATETGGESVVLTFETHPRVVLKRAEGLRLLTTLEEKIILLEELGIDKLIVVPFDKDFSRLSYEMFIKEYLVEKIGAKYLVVGYNHHFGRDSEGSYNSAKKIADEFGLKVERVEEWRGTENENISSTVIRSLLQRGEMERVIEILGRPYLILANVDGDGRVWCSDPLKQIPAEGTYSAIVNGEKTTAIVDCLGVMWCKDFIQDVKIEITGVIK